MNLNEVAFMEIPEGFNSSEISKNSHIMLLKRVLNGVHQAIESGLIS